MGIFRTQFEMKGVLTHVTVEELEKNSFGCLIGLDESFESGESPVTNGTYDIVIKRVEGGKWQTAGEPKVDLEDEEIQSLGTAIEGDKSIELYDSEMY